MAPPRVELGLATWHSCGGCFLTRAARGDIPLRRATRSLPARRWRFTRICNPRTRPLHWKQLSRCTPRCHRASPYPSACLRFLTKRQRVCAHGHAWSCGRCGAHGRAPTDCAALPRKPGKRAVQQALYFWWKRQHLERSHFASRKKRNKENQLSLITKQPGSQFQSSAGKQQFPRSPLRPRAQFPLLGAPRGDSTVTVIVTCKELRTRPTERMGFEAPPAVLLTGTRRGLARAAQIALIGRNLLL